MRFAFTNSVWQRSSKSTTIYPLQIQDAEALRCAFAMFWKDVLLRRVTARTWETSLWLVGAYSLRFVIFAASSGCAAPPQLHIAPFCPQRSCCGLFCVFRASLLFSTSVNLKFRHFKFRAKARRLHLMRPFWRSQKRFGAARSQRSWWSTDCIFAARKRRFFCISCRKHKKMQSARRRRSRRSSPPTTSFSPPNQQPHFFPH